MSARSPLPARTLRVDLVPGCSRSAVQEVLAILICAAACPVNCSATKEGHSLRACPCQPVRTLAVNVCASACYNAEQAAVLGVSPV